MGIFTRTGYNKKYCILHPWKVVMHKCRDIQCAWQRATKGYCFRDVWAIDDWFARVFPAMLEELIEVHHGYPGDLTDEEWVDILKKMSKSFRNADDEKTEFVNPYKEEYLNTLDFDIETCNLTCSASEELEQNYRNNRKISSKKGANFTPSLDIPKFLWYNYTIADSMFTAIFNQIITIEDLNLQTFFHTFAKSAIPLRLLFSIAVSCLKKKSNIHYLLIQLSLYLFLEFVIPHNTGLCFAAVNRYGITVLYK